MALPILLFSFFISFAYAYKARNEGSPFTSAPKVQ